MTPRLTMDLTVPKVRNPADRMGKLYPEEVGRRASTPLYTGQTSTISHADNRNLQHIFNKFSKADAVMRIVPMS